MASSAVDRAHAVANDLFDRDAPTYGADLTHYYGHVHRVIGLVGEQRDVAEGEAYPLGVAAYYHDAGIWFDDTWDYLPPSIRRAVAELGPSGEQHAALVTTLIDEHHRIRRARSAAPLVEAFRRADLIDVSRGLVTAGVPRFTYGELRRRYPDTGFRRILLRAFGRGLRADPSTRRPCSSSDDGSGPTGDTGRPVMARSGLVTSGNERIAEDVRAELRADPAVPDHGIEVHVHHGTVHLRGSVPGLLQKQQALQDAHRIRGVRDVVDELGVELPERWVRPDSEVQDAVREVLRHHAAIPSDAVTVRAHRGSVTLHGSVDHDYQRRAAATAAGAVWGVRDVVDRITLRPVENPVDVLNSIRAALLRNALLEHARITVAIDGDVVTLSGTVGVRAERQEAERVAWGVPGVVEVRDHLIIKPRQT